MDISKRDAAALRIWVEHQPASRRQAWRQAMDTLPGWMRKGIAMEARRRWMGEPMLARGWATTVAAAAAIFIRMCT